MAIYVLGSVNVDESIYVEMVPEEGQTIFSDKTETSIGGKGFNQAVTVHKLGGQVHFIGARGTDTYGEMIQHAFQQLGLSEGYLDKQEGISGKATIMVSKQGENRIIVEQGVNSSVNPPLHLIEEGVIAPKDIIIAQLEIPSETIYAMFKLAKSQGITTILNPAPAGGIESKLLEVTDILIPNEGELEAILSKLTGERSRATDMELIFNYGVQYVIETRGSRGVTIHSVNHAPILQPSYKVKVVDTTAAGDSFVGAFAYHYHECDDVAHAVQQANMMAALTVQRRGTSNAIASRQEFDTFRHQLQNK